MSIYDCKIIDLQKFADEKGALTPIESGKHLPFEFKRVFYFYDVPTGEPRGSHAHKACHQFIVCLSGSFDVLLDDGKNKTTHHLNRPWQGLYLAPMVWASQVNFDPGTVGLVLASDHFDEADYYRDYRQFLAAISTSK
jgi:hypothetical protein